VVPGSSNCQAITRRAVRMAQDFYAAFGLGDTDRGYYSVDAHGVALAAIKALAEQVDEQNARIEWLERDNRELRDRTVCGQ
jgi:hypothetical protein